jgi:hypothetical protein
LAEIKKTHQESYFKAHGAIYADEILLAITLSHGPNQIAATTVYSSADYNPNQEVPALTDVLAACLDSIGSVFGFYLDPASPEKVAQIAHQSLGALEEAPFEWTPTEIENTHKISVFVKLDKSNPTLDALADEWLMKNDPHYQEELEKKENRNLTEAEEFLDERLQAIKNAKSGTSSGGGPITH